MRFVYIDSQDKEVSVPGVDALRLRIELGAIVDETMVYDASTDRWAPAADHEIFRTLKRELDGPEGGRYTAPPPPPVTPPPPVAPPAPPAADDDVASLESLAPDDEAPAPEVPTGSPPASEPPAPSEPFPLAPNPFEALEGPTPIYDDATDGEDAVDAASARPDEPAAPGAEWDLGIDLTLDEGVADPVEEAEPATPVVPDDESADRPFDFGAYGELELEAPPGGVPTDDDGAEGPAHGEEGGSSDGIEGMEDLGGGLDLEPSLADSPDGVMPPWMTGQPSPDEPDPDEPPAWTQGTSPAESPPPAPLDGDFPDRDSVRRKLEARRAVEARGGRTAPRSAPGSAGPQRRPVKRRRRGLALPLGLAVLAVVGIAGGWYAGVQLFAGDDGAAPDAPTVTLPALPDRLEPRLRTLSQRATRTMIEGLAALPEREAVPPEPDPDWLGGRYMANASAYPGIPLYWQAVSDWVAAMRTRDDEFFRQAYRDQVAAEGLAADDAQLLLVRGQAGFEAAERDRGLVYDQLDAVARSALSLHAFLEANESDIDFEPAVGGLSRDPVLEAVPASEELGDEMWQRVGEITDALDALGLLDRVTTARLADVFFEKLGATPIR
jgi:hypothetical protein